MKIAYLIATGAVLSAAFIVGAAQAQSGRPSFVQIQQHAEATVSREQSPVSQDELGSYGRYLVLNGKPRDVAIEMTRNIDHPQASRSAAQPVDVANAGAHAPSVNR